MGTSWSVCPRCLYRAHSRTWREIKDALTFFARHNHEDALDRLTFDISVLPEPDRTQYMTFCESWSMSDVYNGMAELRYTGDCPVCGLRIAFSTARSIPETDGEYG